MARAKALGTLNKSSLLIVEIDILLSVTNSVIKARNSSQARNLYNCIGPIREYQAKEKKGNP